MPHMLPRRAALAGIALSILPAGGLFAQDREEPDPIDLVPRRFSPEAFARLDANELYMANLAVSRGRRILIDGYSASESRRIIRAAAKNPARARLMLRQ